MLSSAGGEECGQRNNPRAKSRWLPRVQHPHGLQNDVPRDLQTLRTQLVDCILRGVMKNVSVAVVEIDQIGAGNPQFHERQMIVLNVERAREKVRLVAKSCSGLVYEVF